MTPERVANKRFASPSFNLDGHLAQQIAKFRRRLVVGKAALSSSYSPQ
jgi:hypothetical protein